MEPGTGIHGELGRTRMKMAGANELVCALLDRVADDLDLKRGVRCSF